MLLGDQADLQHARAEIEIRLVASRLGEPSDLPDQLHTGGEVPRAEDGESHRPQDSPVVDAGRVVELSGGDPLSHGFTVGAGTDSGAPRRAEP